jgi:hypothetical protein
MNEMFHDVHVETHALGACAILRGSGLRARSQGDYASATVS